MTKIPAVSNNGVFSPSQDFPSDTLMVVFDGVEYLAYQPGDNLPAQQQTSPEGE